jgi:hypothetical protein
MTMKNTRLAGHGLRYEGRYYAPGSGYRSGGMAPGTCECGAKSEPLPSAAARKRWHAGHKADIRG